MTVRHVKSLVEAWIAEHAAPHPGYHGAFYRGSMTSRKDTDEHPLSSDVDLTLVYEKDVPSGLGGRILDGGILFCPGGWPIDRLLPVEDLISDYRLGHSFRHPHILPGASDRLTELADEATVKWPQIAFVRKRLEDARANCLRYCRLTDEAENEVGRVMCWLWAAGITTHVILVAGLENPTVRKRYLAARSVLERFDRSDFYEEIQTLQGSRNFDRAITQAWLDQVTELFDVACQAGKTDLPFQRDIKPEGRATAIGGSQELIDQGNHREAVYWIVATWTRSLRALEEDGDVQNAKRYRVGLDELMRELGVGSIDAFGERTEAVKQILPSVMEVAEQIVDIHPDVVRT